jgi:hypothetical protein
MFSAPSVSIQPNVSINGTVTTSYTPLIYPSNTTISASALTPSSAYPVPLVPTVATVATNGLGLGLGLGLNGLAPLSTHPYFNPLIPSVVTYPDVNSNADLRREITEYFFEKIVNNWLKYHYVKMYHMLTVNGDNVSLVKSIDQIASNNKNDPKENAIKYQFLLINYFAKNDVYKLLDKFRKTNRVNWWNIKHMSDDVRKFIQHKVMKYMKKQIMDPALP